MKRTWCWVMVSQEAEVKQETSFSTQRPFDSNISHLKELQIFKSHSCLLVLPTKCGSQKWWGSFDSRGWGEIHIHRPMVSYTTAGLEFRFPKLVLFRMYFQGSLWIWLIFTILKNKSINKKISWPSPNFLV